MTDLPTTEGTGTLAQRAKARIKRIAGWLTADRRVEAEGEAELRTGEAQPPHRRVERVEHEVRERYGETLD